MATKRQKGKRREEHNAFKAEVRSALDEVEAECKRQRKKKTPAYIMAQMAKRGWVPRDVPSWDINNPLHWQMGGGR